MTTSSSQSACVEASDVARDGFCIVESVAPVAERERLLSDLGSVDGPGRRGLLRLNRIAAFACSEAVLALVRPHLPREPRPVRAIYFNKSPEANWLVPWHQDLTIAVKERRDATGFQPWSVKDGVLHVQPPSQLMEQMLTFRLHFDDTDETNGALRVLAGSHSAGRLVSDRIQELRARHRETVCRAKAGDALLMRPLLLHASAHSQSARPRRVLHIEYAAFDLPDGLEWHESPAFTS